MSREISVFFWRRRLLFREQKKKVKMRPTEDEQSFYELTQKNRRRSNMKACVLACVV